MISELQVLLTVVAAVGSGLIAGTFLAFSAFVMRALERLPAPHGVAAMQSINVVAINPGFLSAFLGTGLVCAVLCAGAVLGWHETHPIWLIAGSMAYLLGCLLVTMTRNVPMNTALARVASASPEAGRYWPESVSRWTLWNHLRMASSLAAMICFIAALREPQPPAIITALLMILWRSRWEQSCLSLRSPPITDSSRRCRRAG